MLTKGRSRIAYSFPKVRPHAPDTVQTPSRVGLSLWRRFQLSLWTFGGRLQDHDVKYAVKTGMATAMLAAPAFIEATRPTFMEYRGEWALISVSCYVVVCCDVVMTFGRTVLCRDVPNYRRGTLGSLGFVWRSKHNPIRRPTSSACIECSAHCEWGSIIWISSDPDPSSTTLLIRRSGAVTAATAYTLFHKTPVMLAIFGFFFSMPCFYYIVAKPQYATTGRFVLLTYNLTCLFRCARLREREIIVF